MADLAVNFFAWITEALQEKRGKKKKENQDRHLASDELSARNQALADYEWYE